MIHRQYWCYPSKCNIINGINVVHSKSLAIVQYLNCVWEQWFCEKFRNADNNAMLEQNDDETRERWCGSERIAGKDGDAIPARARVKPNNEMNVSLQAYNNPRSDVVGDPCLWWVLVFWLFDVAVTLNLWKFVLKIRIEHFSLGIKAACCCCCCGSTWWLVGEMMLQYLLLLLLVVVETEHNTMSMPAIYKLVMNMIPVSSLRWGVSFLLQQSSWLCPSLITDKKIRHRAGVVMAIFLARDDDNKISY